MNSTGRILQAIGVIDITVGIVIFVAAVYSGGFQTGLTVGLVYMLGCILSGIVFYGFGEVINLLQKVADTATRIETKLNGKDIT